MQRCLAAFKVLKFCLWKCQCLIEVQLLVAKNHNVLWKCNVFSSGKGTSTKEFGKLYVTEFVKTDLMGTNTEIQFLPLDEKSCTHALKNRWPGLLFQAAIFQCCQTTRVDFMAFMAPEGH